MVRATLPDRQVCDSVSTLLIGVCPGPPRCSAVHTYLYVDGLDLIARSNGGAVGGCPDRLLRPGGPLYPSDRARTVDVAVQDHASNSSCGVEVRVRLRGQTVIWTDLMYPGADGRVIEEVRFDLRQYLTEIERGYALWGHSAPHVQHGSAATGAAMPDRSWPA
ncbi:hypothetical protein [Kitasatospora camelliae]|uniref:Uncharacterized protein n=1 Tax=Kitasatospora camelliae TaxID=3156397 RepID=A0AAU8K7M5_9ACTN